MQSGLLVSSNEENEKQGKIDMKWVLISVAVSIVLSRFSRNSMCTYLFLSFSWIFLAIIATQAYGKFERDNISIAATSTAALVGWIIGTTLVWKTRHIRVLFFEK